MYHSSVCPLIPYVLQGHNASVFAYGPTGAGKNIFWSVLKKIIIFKSSTSKGHTLICSFQQDCAHIASWADMSHAATCLAKLQKVKWEFYLE